VFLYAEPSLCSRRDVRPPPAPPGSLLLGRGVLNTGERYGGVERWETIRGVWFWKRRARTTQIPPRPTD